MAKEAVNFWPPTLRTKYNLDGLSAAKQPLAGILSADIGWTPDIAKFNERNTKRPARENITMKLPKGWPLSLQGPLAWSTNSFLEESEYTYVLSPLEIAEVDTALSHVKG